MLLVFNVTVKSGKCDILLGQKQVCHTPSSVVFGNQSMVWSVWKPTVWFICIDEL